MSLLAIIRDWWHGRRAAAAAARLEQSARLRAAQTAVDREQNRALAVAKQRSIIEALPILPDKGAVVDGGKVARAVKSILERTDLSAPTKRQLIESLPTHPDWVVPYQDWLNSHSWDGMWWGTITGLTHRNDGSDPPFFRSEMELQILRDMSRMLVKTNNHAKGMIKARRGYIIRKGYAITVTDKDGKNPQLQAHVQSFFDRWSRVNRWVRRQKEAFLKSSRDGEVFTRVFSGASIPDRMPRIRFIWPEQVKNPGGALEWSYGVRTHPDDIEAIESYAVFALDGTPSHVEVSARDVFHFKRNVDSGVKRGIPDFVWGLYEVLSSAGKLERNLGEGSAIQASIAYVLEHAVGTKSEIEDAVLVRGDYTTQRMWDRNPTRGVQQFEPGLIVDTDKNTQFKPSPYSAGVDGHLQVVDLLCRSAAVTENAPPWITTSIPSDASFASALVSESPFTINTEDEQEDYQEYFTAILDRVLEVAVEDGLLPREALSAIEIQLEPTPPVARNKGEEASVNKTYFDMRAKSPQQIIKEQGGKPEEVVQEWREWQELTRDLQQAPGGIPGLGGMPPGPPDAPPPTTSTPSDPVPPGGALDALLGGPSEGDAAPGVAESREVSEAVFDESSHPRDDRGRFIGHEELESAKTDAAKADELRSHVTRPEERAKLDAAIGGVETPYGRAAATAGQSNTVPASPLTAGTGDKPWDVIAQHDGESRRDYIKRVERSAPRAKRFKQPSPEEVVTLRDELRATGIPVFVRQHSTKGKPIYIQRADRNNQVFSPEENNRIREILRRHGYVSVIDGLHMHPIDYATVSIGGLTLDADGPHPSYAGQPDTAGDKPVWATTIDEYIAAHPLAPRIEAARQSQGTGNNSVELVARVHNEHLDKVRAALAAGKPVPPHVLADYPDLAAKYGKLAESVGEPIRLEGYIRSVERGTPECTLTPDEIESAIATTESPSLLEARPGLVRKEITNKAGRKQVVWVRAQDGEAPHTERPRVEETVSHVENLRSNFTTEGLLALATALQHHTVAELKQLKQQLGIAASGRKAELAKKIAERALGGGAATGAKARTVPNAAPAKPAASPAARLADMIERSRSADALSAADIDAYLGELGQLRLPDLVAAAKGAGIARPGSSKAQVLATIRGRLTATRRMRDENEV